MTVNKNREDLQTLPKNISKLNVKFKHFALVFFVILFLLFISSCKYSLKDKEEKQQHIKHNYFGQTRYKRAVSMLSCKYLIISFKKMQT